VDVTPRPDTDELVEELRRRVAERREAGVYPAGLEEDLDAHFRRVAAHRRGNDLSALRASLDALDARSGFSAERIPLDASVPGGRQVHQLVSRAVARQTQGILQQVQEFADAVRDTLARVADVLEDADGHVHTDLIGQLDALWERLAGWERGPVESGAALADLRRRVEVLEGAEETRRFRAPYTPEAFASAFRGSREERKLRQRDLASRFTGQSPVLDVGSGRGEFLELLGELGVDARGVELDRALVDDCRRRGLDVDHGDGLLHLASRPDGSLGGIALIEVLEHLSPGQVVDLLAVAQPKLRHGGVLVIEAGNPLALAGYVDAFHLDPSRRTPLHPAYLRFLLTESGWHGVEIEWRSLPTDGDLLEADEAGDGVAAANTRRLNELLFGPRDYALVALR